MSLRLSDHKPVYAIFSTGVMIYPFFNIDFIFFLFLNFFFSDYFMFDLLKIHIVSKYFFLVRRLDMGREAYIASIVDAHRIHYEAKAPEREQRIARACASYEARNPELMHEIYNSEGDVSDDGDSDDSEECSE